METGAGSISVAADEEIKQEQLEALTDEQLEQLLDDTLLVIRMNCRYGCMSKVCMLLAGSTNDFMR